MNDTPVDEREKMEFWYLQLIDYIVNDIEELELEVIRLRYELSKRLPYYKGVVLRSEIYSDLAGRYEWHEAYQKYVRLYRSGQDPLENKSYYQKRKKMARQGYLDE